MAHYVITGGAGFIGSNLIRYLFDQEEGVTITCIDNFDDFYSRKIKELNISAFADRSSFRLIECDIATTGNEKLQALIPDRIDAIIHLAAKAGVRPSINNPDAYQQVNILGLQHLLDFTKDKGVKQFVFASSSSVYGANDHFPWKESEMLRPISPYAMTKLAGEMLGHVYHQLYDIRFIALRFFTVYGPAQRPDLAIHRFTRNIIKGLPIPMYGDGNSQRDYTFVDDILSGIMNAIHYEAGGFEIFNLGNHNMVSLQQLIFELEHVLGKKAVIERLPEQAGDLLKTYADISRAVTMLNYKPCTDLRQGLVRFANWFYENRSVLLDES